MNVLIGLLILSAFLQTSFLGINIVLLIIVVRSFIVESTANYYLALFAGILLGLLSVQNLGFWPFIFLLTVKIAHLLRRMPFNIGILTALPAIVIAISITVLSEYFFLKQTPNHIKIIAELITSIPIFIIIRFWEERFIIHPSTVKLKLRK